MTESNIYKVFLAFGGNLGQPLAQFRHAVALLQQQPQIKRISCSPVYQTPAIGGPANQPDYLNAVVEIRTDMPADRLLHLCQQIEDQAGRTREVHWGPRTLDIDLLFFADLTIDTPELTLPHPRLHQRHFVLLPLYDLAPNLIHPLLGLPVKDLLQRLPPAQGIRQIQKTW